MENFNDVINNNQLLLIDFFATWCGPCKIMHPILEELKEELGDNIRIIKIDVNKNEELSRTYHIESIPTFILVRAGKVLWRHSGVMSVIDLKTIISKYQ